LPNLSEVAQDPSTLWKPITVANWYGSEPRTLEIASQTAVSGTPRACSPCPCALGVGARSAKGGFNPQALLCTDLKAHPQKILCWFVMRWHLDVTFQMRRHLGFETQRQWSEMAIRRTTPALLRLFSMITLEPMGFEPTPSAVQRRRVTLLEVSGVCRYPANERFSASSLFPTFQESYSGCCTVAAPNEVACNFC
jgi:hypothetical protein